MEIKFVYPDMSADEFEETLDGLNNDIDNSNRLSSIPRFISWVFGVAMFFLTLVFIYLSWKLVIFLITGRDRITIIAGLALAAAMVPSAISLQRRLAPALKQLLLKLLRLKDYEEKFTVLEYADRDNMKKKLAEDLKYYHFCDELRSHPISDASVNYDGNECEIDISFKDERLGTDVVRRIKLPLRMVASNNIVVDLERRIVLFPEGE